MFGPSPRRRNRDDEHENPAWPGLVDLFAFGMVVMLLLWVQSIPPPKPPTGGGQPTDPFGGIDFKGNDIPVVHVGDKLQIKKFPGEIYFEQGHYDLKPSDAEALRNMALRLNRALLDRSDVRVVVNGTADPVPLSSAVPPRNNVELSALRAAEVSRTLLDGGLDRQLSIVGLGEQGTLQGAADQMKELRRVYLELETSRTSAP